jgi:restriction endonuclease Mrr
MAFPTDIKNAMRDCILKLFWLKDDIVKFCRDSGVTNNDIQSLGNYKEIKRSQIIDRLFEILSQSHGNGLAQFRVMMQSLVDWSYFDPYYFEQQKTLKKEDAQRAIDHLKQLQEIRDSKIKEERKLRECLEKQLCEPSKKLKELNDLFISSFTNNSNHQQRGYDLEKLLLDLARLNHLEVTEQFRVNGEQIDGAIKYDGEHYILEAKWQDKALSNEPIYQFASKVEGKMYGRGFFISINGFSENVISSLLQGKAIRTIFIDGADLMLVLEGHLSFSDMIDKKIKAAQTKGLIYIDAIAGNSKIKN